MAASATAQVIDVPVPGDPVRIDSGAVAGNVMASGVKAYLGVPYAAPPVGPLRWREPQAVAPWRGVYNADRKAPECRQVLRPRNLNHYFGEEATSEDCLYVNVWAPADAADAKPLPVIVWIYGGGFTIGSSAMGNYDGELIARRGVVFVSLNYRVGVFGFLAHPELTAESPHHASGNYGLLDQVAALRWVQRNISRFGGDPGSVTIMGQSSGAASASYLQVSPLARGLFHRIVALSGSANGPTRPTPDLKSAEADGVAYQTALKAPSVAAMRDLPADRVLAPQADCQLGCAGSVKVGPDVDGYYLPQAPLEAFKARAQADVPMLLSFTRDESGNALKAAKTADAYKAAAESLYGSHAAAFLKLYPVSADAAVREVGGAAARDAGVARVMRDWGRAQLQYGKAPVYMAMFSYTHPYADGVAFADHDPKTAGAYHTADVPYWFQSFAAYNRFRVTRNWGAADRALSDAMGDALVSFARIGNPGTAAHPWPAYDAKRETFLEFGDSIRTAHFDARRFDFHARMPAQPMLPANPSTPRD